jgi:hypothetical protein
MDKLKNINKQLLNSEKKYNTINILKLSNNDRTTLQSQVKTETSYLLLTLYIIIICFTLLTIVIIVKGDKLNPHPIHNKFKDDSIKQLSIWDKLHYLVFGYHTTNKKSQLAHLKCDSESANDDTCNNMLQNSKITITSNDKYNYLETFNNISSETSKFFTDCNNNTATDQYTHQFDESRKCLKGGYTNATNTYNNNKYSYLQL